MRIDSRSRFSTSYSSYAPLGVKWLLIVNVVLYIVYFFAARTEFGPFFRVFSLAPRAVLEHFAIWQIFTYMFLHDPFGFGHILFNMLSLWMFGSDLERLWGTRRFLNYYFLCGAGAGLCDVAANWIFNSLDTRTIGASGAIYGLLLAYGVLFPDRTIYFNFLFPIKAKYFVMIMGAIAFLSAFGSASGVSHVAHLGGMLFGYLAIRMRWSGVRLDFSSITGAYQKWKLARAKRKFQVYLRKHGPPRDPWVN